MNGLDDGKLDRMDVIRFLRPHIQCLHTLAGTQRKRGFLQSPMPSHQLAMQSETVSRSGT